MLYLCCSFVSLHVTTLLLGQKVTGERLGAEGRALRGFLACSLAAADSGARSGSVLGVCWGASPGRGGMGGTRTGVGSESHPASAPQITGGLLEEVVLGQELVRLVRRDEGHSWEGDEAGVKTWGEGEAPIGGHRRLLLEIERAPGPPPPGVFYRWAN